MSRTKKLWVASLIALHAFGIGCAEIDPYIVPVEPKPQPTQHQVSNVDLNLTAQYSGAWTTRKSTSAAVTLRWNADAVTGQNITIELLDEHNNPHPNQWRQTRPGHEGESIFGGLEFNKVYKFRVNLKGHTVISSPVRTGN
jgi:hypothetical protein